MFAVVGRIGWSLALPGYLLFVATGTVLAGIDVAARRVPDMILLPAFVLGVVLLCIASAVEGDSAALARAGLGGAAPFSFFSCSSSSRHTASGLET